MNVMTEVHQDDHIYSFLLNHFKDDAKSLSEYIRTGDYSANLLRDAIDARTSIDVDRPFSLLEFASGYGGVTRHMGSVIPTANVTASDIHPQAMMFIHENIGVKTLQSVSNPNSFSAGQQYDVVFALSFFSHMPDRTFAPWLAALYSAVRTGGYLIFTTHGIVSVETRLRNSVDIKRSPFFAFQPLSEQADLDPQEYGSMYCTPGYVIDALAKCGARVSSLQEGHWWEHQDTYIVRKD